MRSASQLPAGARDLNAELVLLVQLLLQGGRVAQQRRVTQLHGPQPEGMSRAVQDADLLIQLAHCAVDGITELLESGGAKGKHPRERAIVSANARLIRWPTFQFLGFIALPSSGWPDGTGQL
jgi:hypothetical protein